MSNVERLQELAPCDADVGDGVGWDVAGHDVERNDLCGIRHDDFEKRRAGFGGEQRAVRVGKGLVERELVGTRHPLWFVVFQRVWACLPHDQAQDQLLAVASSVGQVAGCRQRQVDAASVPPCVPDKVESKALFGWNIRVRGVHKEPNILSAQAFQVAERRD